MQNVSDYWKCLPKNNNTDAKMTQIHTHHPSLSPSYTHTLSLPLSHTHTLSLSPSHTHTSTHTHAWIHIHNTTTRFPYNVLCLYLGHRSRILWVTKTHCWQSLLPFVPSDLDHQLCCVLLLKPCPFPKGSYRTKHTYFNTWWNRNIYKCKCIYLQYTQVHWNITQLYLIKTGKI